MLAAPKPSSLGGMRVLVTGANGFIGTHLTHRLVALGAQVTTVERDPSRAPAAGRPDLRGAALTRAAADLRDGERVREVVRQSRPQVVFHLAAHPDGREDGEQVFSTLNANVLGTANLLEALRELPSASVVYGCSSKVYGTGEVPYRADQVVQPLSSYGVSKLAAWGLIDLYRRVHGIRAVALRPTLVYGPGQGFNLFTFLCQAIARGDAEIGLDGGSQTRDPLYIDDVVDAFVAAGERLGSLNGETLPIGGGREVSVAEIAETTVRLVGSGQRVVSRPANVRPTEMLRSWCDNREALAALGWQPRVSLEEGIVLTAEVLGLRGPAVTPQP